METEVKFQNPRPWTSRETSPQVSKRRVFTRPSFQYNIFIPMSEYNGNPSQDLSVRVFTQYMLGFVTRMGVNHSVNLKTLNVLLFEWPNRNWI